MAQIKADEITQLIREQIENYLDLARDNGFDAVITISNQLAPAMGVHPVDVDKRKLRKVALHHVSWAEVVSAAVVQRVHAGVSDPEQAWILVPVDMKLFGNRGRDQLPPGEFSERVPFDEFRARLEKTLKFLEQEKRPHWQTVVKEHSEFLKALGEKGQNAGAKK